MASGEMSDDEFMRFLGRVWAQAKAALVPGGLAYVCMDWRNTRRLLQAFEDNGLDLLNLIVWDKVVGGMGSTYRSRHELIFLARKPGAQHTNRIELGKHGRDRTNVWSYEGMSGTGEDKRRLRSLHPAVKPAVIRPRPPRSWTTQGSMFVGGAAGMDHCYLRDCTRGIAETRSVISRGFVGHG
jgi:DNA modification methylase